MPPSARGSCFGLRRISSFVNPDVTTPAVARAVHHDVSLLLWGEPLWLVWRAATVRPTGDWGASKSTFSDTGGTNIAPGHSCTTLTSLTGSTFACGLNL